MNSTTQIQSEQGIEFLTKLKTANTISPFNNKEQSRQRSFEELFLEAADSAFLLIGECCSRAIYGYLENQYGLKKESIPWNISAFAQAIEDIFGQGARLLEIKIMRTLYDSVSGFKYLPEYKEFSFAAYVEALRCFL